MEMDEQYSINYDDLIEVLGFNCRKRNQEPKR